MDFSKKKLCFAMLMALTLTVVPKMNTKVVKADAAVQGSNAIVVRSTDFNSGKVLKVPQKPKVVVTKAGSSKTLSRGSSTSSKSSSSSQSYDSIPAPSNADGVVAYAFKFMGRPYVWGASGPSAFDCSGFTAYVYSAFGVSLGHFTGSQFGSGCAVSRNALAPGDLVFFNTYSSVSHVGIYIGGGQFIHASSGSGRVTVSNLSESYYASRYAGARRVK